MVEEFSGLFLFFFKVLVTWVGFWGYGNRRGRACDSFGSGSSQGWGRKQVACANSEW